MIWSPANFVSLDDMPACNKGRHHCDHSEITPESGLQPFGNWSELVISNSGGSVAPSRASEDGRASQMIR